MLLPMPMEHIILVSLWIIFITANGEAREHSCKRVLTLDFVHTIPVI